MDYAAEWRLSPSTASRAIQSKLTSSAAAFPCVSSSVIVLLALLFAVAPAHASNNTASSCAIFNSTFQLSAALAGPISVISGDIDGDGFPDIISTASYSGALAWYANVDGTGNPTNRQHIIDDEAEGVTSVAAGDIDGDGDVDVVAAYDGTVAWYENVYGDGATWVKNYIFNYPPAGTVSSVFLADVHNDGALDVLSAHHDQNIIVVYKNDVGNGTQWTTSGIDSSISEPVQVTAADVDGDGLTDAIAISTTSNEIAWFKNMDSSGTSWAKNHSSTSANNPSFIFAADVDHDGDVDVVAAETLDSAPSIVLYENKLADRASWLRHTVSTNVNNPTSVFVADVDGDNASDILSSSSGDDTVAWYKNNDNTNLGDWTQNIITDSASSANSVIAVDMDDDGDTDVVSGNSSPALPMTTFGQITLYKNADSQGSGSTWDFNLIAALLNSPASVFPADVDGDGDLDVVAAILYEGSVVWFENVGPSATTANPFKLEHYISTNATSAFVVHPADVDGDGDIDVLSASLLDGTISLHKNADGAGALWEEIVITPISSATTITTEDIDGDGDVDVVAGGGFYASGFPAVWFENTVGNASVWAEHSIGVPNTLASSVVAASFDADTTVDVMSADNANGVLVLHKNVLGTGALWENVTVSTTITSALAHMSASDVDGDQDLDIVCSLSDQDEGGAPRIVWFENPSADGSLWQEHIITTDLGLPVAVSTADVDGDGDVDVFSSDIMHSLILLFTNEDDSGTEWNATVIADNIPSSFGLFASDVDGDGDVDLLSADLQLYSVLMFENTGTCEPFMSPAPDTPSTAQSRDVIIIASSVSGGVALIVVVAIAVIVFVKPKPSSSVGPGSSEISTNVATTDEAPDLQQPEATLVHNPIYIDDC